MERADDRRIDRPSMRRVPAVQLDDARDASRWRALECSPADGGTHEDTHRIAVIPGDGIGKEVVPEGLRVLEAAARKFGIAIEWREFDWNCDYYAKHGRMMPEDWFEHAARRSTRSTTARSAGRRPCRTTSRCGAR